MVNKISVEKWNTKKVFVARDEKGHFMTWAPETSRRYRNIKEFRKSVVNQRFRFSEQVEENLEDEIKVGEHIIEARTKKFVSDKNYRYRVIASININGQFYSASSSIIKNSYGSDVLQEAQNQALYSLATQIVMNKKGYVTYDDSVVEENDEDIEEIMQQILDKVKFEYIYSHKIKGKRG